MYRIQKKLRDQGFIVAADLQLTNVKNNRATLEYLAESTTTTAPSLEGARLVIETVHFLNKEGGITSVDGEWAFELTSANIVTQEYVAEKSVPGLTLQQAIVTNGSMQVTFKVDNISNENENIAFETALVDGNGESFYAKGANIERLEEVQQTVITLVFPYSVWNEQQSLSLKVKDYKELKLVKKE